MALPMAAWRLSYTVGNWIAMSGPTSLLLMPPAPPSVAQFLSDTWRGVATSRSADHLFDYIAQVGISELPNFGAFFWDAKGLHGIARGDIQVLSRSGEVALSGKGYLTWKEESLDADEIYHIYLEPDREDKLRLPMVVGAAMVSSVTFSTAKDQLLRFPDSDYVGALEKVPVLGLRPRKPKPQPAVASDPQPEIKEPAQEATALDGIEATQEPPQDPSGIGAAPLPAADLSNQPAIEEESAAQLSVEADNETSLPAAEPSAEESQSDSSQTSDSSSQGQPFDPAMLDTGEMESPIPPPLAPTRAGILGDSVAPQPHPAVARVVPGTFGEVEEDNGTIFSTDLAATHKPSAPLVPPDDQILAVPCMQGHPNPVGAQSCRLCHAPVDSRYPRLIRQPLIAGINTSYGDFVNLYGCIVVGRSPDPSKGRADCELLKVPSPQKDISRSHLLITAKGWNVIVEDLNSTNGTRIRPQGENPFDLRDGHSAQVGIGTILDLGDGISLRIEAPRGQ